MFYMITVLQFQFLLIHFHW